MWGQAGEFLYHVPPEDARAGEDLTVSVGLLVTRPVIEVTLFYRNPGQLNYQEMDMRFREGMWSAVIPGSKLSDEGLEYLIILRLADGSMLATPRQAPFEHPHRILVKPAGLPGRRFPGSEKAALEKTIQADILILSPQIGELVRPDEVVVAVSLFNVPNIDTSTIRITMNDQDYTGSARITSDIISLYPGVLSPSLYTVKISMSTAYGIRIQPLIWSFAVAAGAVDAEDKISTGGKLDTRASYEKIESQVINISELNAEGEAGVSWFTAQAGLRLTNRESKYLQPLNRYSVGLKFGEYLKVDVGDFFPTMSPFILNGKRVRGLGVNLQIRGFQLQVVDGTLARSVQHLNKTDGAYFLREVNPAPDSTGKYLIYTLDRTGYSFLREINAYRLAVNYQDRYKFGLSILRSKDDRQSVDKWVAGARFSVDSTMIDTTGLSAYASVPFSVYDYESFASEVSQAGAKLEFPDINWSGSNPRENLVLGVEFGSAFDEQKLIFEANWNFSLENRNIWEGSMSRADMDTALDDSLDGLIGVQYDEYGLIIGQPLIIDTSKILDPIKYRDIFTININMNPLLPFDVTSFSDHPVTTIVNMPSVAYNFKLKGYYYRNTVIAEYRQIGPEYVSYGNPYLTSNLREFTLSDRVLLLDNKLLINAQFQHRNNQILKTTVDPYSSNSVSTNVTLAPGPEVPSITVNFQSIGRTNAKTELDTVEGDLIDLRENFRTRNSLMSLTFPAHIAGVKINLVLNYNQVNNADLLAGKRKRGYLFQKPNSQNIALNLNSRFASLPLTTVLFFNRNKLFMPVSADSMVDFTWTAVGVNAVYALPDGHTQITGAFNFLDNSITVVSRLYDARAGVTYQLLNNLTVSGHANLQISHIPSRKKDRLDNDGNGETDEFLEAFGLSSSRITITLGYRF